ncbi:hypothetical protein FisN_16Lh225 [Fistulifera solaris]|uniref:Hemimethylated DNA-binding domain-containing protein n=1 Tax=Fistulifera solaris TaxID=1519565 RepID=A0A1Z5J6K1_FISSO|nr:hypothetical protein FisN_16Lh225 [Fistulifera solaris]|eukprot:GAX09532.1 hypothetical protein FisN_16Lh225 [Fistulifera solaris]
MLIPPPTTAPATPSRVARTLYRHLLKWCRATDPALPLTQWLPPIYLRAPEEVEPYHLEMLATTDNSNDAAVQLARQTLPHAQFHKHHLVVPIMHSGDLRNFFRALFRINAYLPVEGSYQKKRIDNAFQALKSLNQLTSETIAPFAQQRRIDRTGVQFSVGQVVRHREKRWRGVVVGWEKANSAPLSSLTTKQYSSESTVTYHVLVDAGDAHQMNRTTKGITVAFQHEIERETNLMLQRIRHEMVDDMFDGFDQGAFVPPPLLAYTYPNDEIPHRRSHSLPRDIEDLAKQMVQSVQDFANELERIIEQQAGGPLDGLHLTALAAGHVAPTKIELSFVQQVIQESVHPITMVALHVRDLIAFVDQLQDAFTHRLRQHPPIHFRVGDVIRHKVFGYRGVVTGWDDRPVVDVSRWDGIQALIQQGKDPNEMPFYHVVRHTEHHERGLDTPGAAMRYVCQENLEVCYEVADLDVDFEDPAWKREGDEFIPPPLLQFKYGQETDPSIERCLTQMMQLINEWQSDAVRNTVSPDSVAKNLSVSNFMTCLKYCSKLSDASTLQEAIREIRQANPNIDLRWKLAAALDQTLSGKTEKALELFKALVKEDPLYVEAWNKRATCEFMLGMYDEAALSSHKVLELEPKHLPALNGLGLIHFQRTRFDMAAECFSQSIQLDPWSPVAPKLSRCLDILNKVQHHDVLDS